MPLPILATKLFVPLPRSNVVVRSRLIERMNNALTAKLTLVSAPAGFGKTTLVSEWVASSGYVTAWLSLDEGDNDLARFLTYLVAAMRTIASDFGEALLGVLASPLPPSETALTTLINEMAGFAEPVVFVLDDYHVLDSRPVDSALTYLIDHLPQHMHLVITTREDPNIPLARLRARNQLVEIRAADLRFTPDEVGKFLNHVMDLNLSTESIAALDTRTEGWIAGLQLAALSMHGHRDVTGFIQSFTGTHHFVLDYLLEEVLHQQSERVQTFLLHTSILDRLCGPVCDAVLQAPAGTGQASLEYIEHANLFVVPMDSERRWYRYHHLFADLLRQRLIQNSESSTGMDAAECHRRASHWYADNGFTADAIRHAIAAADFAYAADLIELAWLAMDGSFQSATWLSWAKSLPDELVRARPVLSVDYAWGLLNRGELEDAEARLTDAERWLDISNDIQGIQNSSGGMVIVDEAQFRTLPASIATARAYQCQSRGDIHGSVTYGLRALELLPADDHRRRGPAAALLALAQWASGELEDAYQTLADAMANFQKVGSLNLSISGTYGLADIRVTQGRLREAAKIYTRTLQLALAQGQPMLRGTAELYLGLSEIALEQGDLHAALQDLQRCEVLGDQAALPHWRQRLCRIQARFKATQGDLAGALDLLDEAERHYHRTPVPDVRPIPAWRTRIWLAQGRVNEALRWVQETGISHNDDLSYLREFEHITLARVLFAADRLTEALTLLDRLLLVAQRGGRMGSVIEIGVLQALIHQAQRNLAPTLVALERSLRLAEPEGYVRIFMDEGSRMEQLLSQAVAHRIMPDYVGRLLAGAAAEHPPKESTTPHLASAASQSLIEPLSDRELEILRLIALGLSNREICQKLFLALDTIKGHNSRIFAKLSVQRRTEAVARARDLGLV
jgi:LuxR family maltose regulon positive regulatory protein